MYRDKGSEEGSVPVPTRLPRVLTVVGSVAMLVGVLDPMEGSVVILLGSALVAVGAYINKSEPNSVRYWLAVFVLIAIGVGALFGLSAVGGIGGRSGHSMWWGLLILPYPIGWIFGVAGLASKFVAFIRLRHQRALSCK
jgi:hypothetical protein